MEGCGAWKSLINNCLGRRHDMEDQPVEPKQQRNRHGRKSMDRLEGDAARRGKAVGGSQAGLPKPRLRDPLARAAIDGLGQPRQPSPVPGALASNDEVRVPVDDKREYDSAWHEMLKSLHNALRHTRYAVSGRMAMTVWGCNRGARDALSVICPVESKEAVKIWVVSTGGRFALTDSEPDILTFRSQGGGGSSSSSSSHNEPRVWRIRLRWVPEQVFENMPQVEKTLKYDENPHTGEYRTSCVNVLTLPAILDNSASSWANNLARGVSQERLEAMAWDILSTLDHIMELNFQEEGSGPLSADESRHVLDRAFWVPFTRRYPQAPTRFAQCGLGLPSYTQSKQPVPHGGMVYPEALPIPMSSSAHAHPARDAGRSLMARKPVPIRHGETEKAGIPIALQKEPA